MHYSQSVTAGHLREYYMSPTGSCNSFAAIYSCVLLSYCCRPHIVLAIAEDCYSGQVTIIFLVSVGLSVCLSVCLFVYSFSQRSLIRFRSN